MHTLHVLQKLAAHTNQNKKKEKENSLRLRSLAYKEMTA
jgi:hypothetical protein